MYNCSIGNKKYNIMYNRERLLICTNLFFFDVARVLYDRHTTIILTFVMNSHVSGRYSTTVLGIYTHTPRGYTRVPDYYITREFIMTQ